MPYASLYIALMLLLVIIPASGRRRALRIRAIIRKRKKTKGIAMNELVNQFIGKYCTVTVAGFSSYSGTIASVCDSWIRLTEKSGAERLINLDYICDIKEIKKKETQK